MELLYFKKLQLLPHLFDRLPFVENIFYDNSYNERDLVEHKFVKHLDKLVEIGNSISDEQLDAAKQNVRSDFVLHHLFTSVSN